MDFALPVVRVVVPLSPWSVWAYIAKQRARQARQALALQREQELYCRFESRFGRLECAFSAVGRDSPNRPLLGETVRNWLAPGAAGANFLWCESLIEGFALTLVVDGHVSRDGLYAPARVGPELKLTLLHLLRSEDPVEVYCGGRAARGRVDDVLQGLEVASGRVEVLDAPHSLYRHLDDLGTPPTLTRLRDIPKIRAWNQLWRVVRYGILATVLAVVGVAAYWTYKELTTEEVVVRAAPDRLKRNYAQLLATPPAGDVLLAVHAAYRSFVGDPGFAAYAHVTRINWVGARIGTAAASNAPSRLNVTATLNVGDNAWSSKRMASAFRKRFEDHAVGAGWSGLIWEAGARSQGQQGLDTRARQADAFTVARIVDLPDERSPRDALANQQPAPRFDDGFVSRTRDLEEILVDVGAVQVLGSRPLEVYETTEMQLLLPNAYWLDRDIVRWLAGHLNAGPVVLDLIESTVVETGRAAARDGAQDLTTIRFRLVWCVSPRGSTCIEPITEADFAQPGTTAT